MPVSRLARLGSWCYRRRRTVLATWVAALAATLLLVAPLAGDFKADFNTPGSDSAAAEAVLNERFGDRSAETIDVVWHAAAGARSPAIRERVDGLIADARQLEGIGRPLPVEVSPDGNTAIARLQVDPASAGNVPMKTGEELIALARQASDDGLMVAMSGWAISDAQESEVSPEFVGFLIAAIVLLLTFGSLLAAGLPLLTALFGLGIGTTLVGTLAAVMDVPDFAPAVASMMAIGVGIDYALLVITRYRSALAAGREPQDAVAEAIATAGRSVLVAGLVVVVALLGLFAMRLPFLYGVAVSSSLAVLVAALAAVTLLPAMLGFLGRRIDALRIPGSGARIRAGRPSHWVGYSRVIQRHPWTAAIAGLLVIATLAMPIKDFRLGFPDAGNDPAETMTRQAYDLVAAGFGPGASGPLMLTAELPSGGDSKRTLTLLRERVAARPEVLTAAPAQLNRAGDAAVLMVTPRSSPQDPATQRLVDDLRDKVVPPLERSTGMAVNVGGMTAATVDQSEYTLARLPLFIGAVVSLSFLLLLAAFRSLPVAVKAGVLNLLSIGAAYGVVALVADGGWAGQLVGIDTATPVPPFIPVFMFAILFGLSMDYEVFLLSRIREEYLRHGDNARAVSDGLANTGRVITARGGDHDRRLQLVRAGRRRDPQAHGDRPGDRDPRRRDDRADGPRPGDHAAARPRELVAARLDGPAAAEGRGGGARAGADARLNGCACGRPGACRPAAARSISPSAPLHRLAAHMRQSLLFALLADRCLVPAADRLGGRHSDGDDRIIVVGSTLVDRDETAGDVLVGDGDVTIRGTVTGDVVVVDGDVTIRGTVEGNVVTVAGLATLGRAGRVEGDLIYADKEPVQTPGSAVGGDVEKFDVGRRGKILGAIAWLIGITISMSARADPLLLAPRAADAVARTASAKRRLGGGRLPRVLPDPDHRDRRVLHRRRHPARPRPAAADHPAVRDLLRHRAFAIGRRILKGWRILAFLVGLVILGLLALIPIAGSIIGLLATMFGSACCS